MTLIAGFPDLMPWIWVLLFLWVHFSPSTEHKRQGIKLKKIKDCIRKCIYHGNGRACQNSRRQDKTRQDKTRQGKTRQDKTRQDRQQKTRQECKCKYKLYLGKEGKIGEEHEGDKTKVFYVVLLISKGQGCVRLSV